MTLRKVNRLLRQEAPGTAPPGGGAHTTFTPCVMAPSFQAPREPWSSGWGLQSVFLCSEIKGLYCQGRLENPEALGDMVTIPILKALRSPVVK